MHDKPTKIQRSTQSLFEIKTPKYQHYTMKQKIVFLSLAIVFGTLTHLHAEVSAHLNFDPTGTAKSEFGWDETQAGFFANAGLTKPGESHQAAINAWQLPSNYGLPIAGYGIKSNKEGSIFRKLADANALIPGKSLYFSFTLRSGKTGGTRVSFAKEGTYPNQNNAVLQVRQISSGAIRLYEENISLATTADTFFENTMLVVGFIDYTAGVFKLKVYKPHETIDTTQKWDVTAQITPTGTYDRLAMRVANQASVGNVFIGDSWNDVTGL